MGFRIGRLTAVLSVLLVLLLGGEAAAKTSVASAGLACALVIVAAVRADLAARARGLHQETRDPRR
jgi:hypothetical protein